MDVLDLRVCANAIVKVQDALALCPERNEGIHRSHGTAKDVKARFEIQPTVQRQLFDLLETQLFQSIDNTRRAVSLV